MISILFLFLTVCWLGLAAWLWYTAFRPETSFVDAEGCVAFGILIPVFVFGLTSLSPIAHINDLGTLREGQAFIEVREEAIRDIEAQLEGIDVPVGLLNADTPVKTLIETKSSYVRDVVRRKDQMIEARLNITRRSLGPGAWAVWVFGEE